MTMVCLVETLERPLALELAAPWPALGAGTRPLHLYWLGQAGFVIDSASARYVIDPYLSDSLADKYRGTRFPHVRMMPPPVAPEALRHVDAVLCTHRHTDHMDPGTLPALMHANPGAVLVAPEASKEEAGRRCGQGSERLLLADHERMTALPGGRLLGLASAHESLQFDHHGHSEWLGYVIEIDGLRLYHSGDCIPYQGLAERLRSLAVDIALLPVNGRDPARSGNGVPGNFTLDEAVALAASAGIPCLLAHHHGLFDFSTVSNDHIDGCVDEAGQQGVQLLRAALGRRYLLTAACGADRPELQSKPTPS